MTHMQKKVVDLISKAPSQRRDIHIQIILPWLRRKSELFKDMDKDILSDVIRNCAYQKAIADDVIITQGDRGNNFYIMLTGRTSVYIDTTKSDDDETNTEAPVPSELSTVLDLKESCDENDDEDGDEKKPLNRGLYGKFIMHYEAGKSFGEVALMSEDSVRNATIISDEDTDLLVISRELFNRSVKAKQEEEYEERKSFINTSPYFHNWSLRFRRLLEMSIRKEHYPSGSTIVEQGDPVLGLVFILSGQAKVTVRPGYHNSQFPLIMKQDINPIAKEIGRDTYNKVVKKKAHTFLQHQIQVRRKEGYAAAEKRIMGKNVELSCIEANDIVGDVEMALDLEKSIFSVTCTEKTSVMILETKNYDRLIAKRNQTTINKLCRTALQKIQTRLQSGNGSRVPILRILHNKLKEKLCVKQETYEKPKIDKTKSEVLELLIDMFLRGKVPLIEPCVPDSLYYRKKSEKRAKMIEIQEKKNEKNNNQTSDKRIEDRLYSFRPKTRVARSLKQLKNVRAENELLAGGQSAATMDVSFPSASIVIRPRTAIGIRRETPLSSTSNGRPHTAGIFHLTESFKEEEDDSGFSQPPPVPHELEGGVGDLLKQLDLVQKGKSENRSKVLCSAVAASEIRNNLKNGSLSTASLGEHDPFDEEYFDWETSEKKLCSLEDRVKQFCTADTSSRRTITVPALRRFCIRDERDEHLEISVPKPGGTVFVRSRPCSVKSNKTDPDFHQHVRRFMVSRDETPDFSPMTRRRPKSAAMSRNVSSRNSSTTTLQRPKTAIQRAISVIG